MSASQDDRRWAWAACSAAAPVLALPIVDPDLWWHLSAGRWIAGHHRVPAADWLSHTLAGAPWVDFEWLAQLSFWAVHRCAGMAGLLALKVLLLAGAAAVLHSLLRRLELPAFWRAFGVAFWFASVIPRADIRTELYSVLAFALLLRRLRTGPPPGPAASLLFFCLWANLHAGFVYGLALLALFAAFEPRGRGRLLAALAAGAAGTLLNPYGWSVYRVLLEHSRQMDSLRRFIVEWAPLSAWRPSHRPVWLLLLGWAAAWLAHWRRAGRPRLDALSAATVLFGAGVLAHSRLMIFFSLLAVPAALELAGSAGLLERAWRSPMGRLAGACGPRLAAALCAAGFFAALWWGRWGHAFEGFYKERLFPAEAAAWIEKTPGLLSRRAYNPWEWGGYLGWRLPGLRVFQDGRYLFHPFLGEENEALASPVSWQAYLDRHGVDLAILKSPPRRPMPPERWDLAYSDGRTLVYLRRAAPGALDKSGAPD